MVRRPGWHLQATLRMENPLQVRSVEPAIDTTDVERLCLATANRSAYSHRSNSEESAPDRDRTHRLLHGPLCESSTRAATGSPCHSADNAPGDMPQVDAQVEKGVDPVNRLLAGYGT